MKCHKPLAAGNIPHSTNAFQLRVKCSLLLLLSYLQNILYEGFWAQFEPTALEEMVKTLVTSAMTTQQVSPKILMGPGCLRI